ncbi:MAG: M16 family metallopeptidase [Pyrinomonadaceae bacterium]
MIIRRPSFLLYITLIVLTFAAISPAQRPSATPRQEKLLNGLKVLVWHTPGAEKATVRLRIHAGSSFDPQDKEGVMQLLAESFFPNPDSRSFFRDELGGSFDLICNYDYIQINASASNDSLLTLLDTLAQALANPDLSKEATASLKTSLLERIKDAEKDGAYIADRAIAKRLFGAFPYGRPGLGTTQSVEKIDFADLRFARNRLLTADNATLAISGDIDRSLALRAARRYFGSWAKSDKRVPSTFRQPEAPDAAVVKVEMPGLANSEVRYAIRGESRASKDFAAAEIFARVLNARLSERVSAASGSNASVTHDAHILPGAFVFRYRSEPSSPLLLSADSSNATPLSFHSLLGRPITEAEFAAARDQVLAGLGSRNVMDQWLDVDTFRITSVADDTKAFQNTTLADVNSLSTRLTREPLAAAVVTVPPVAASNTSN